VVIGPPQTAYEGGIFPAILEFPPEFPSQPPKMRFLCQMYHPNIRETGEVCISILDSPCDDKSEYEDRCRRWLPNHTVKSILLAVISMLTDPNCDSPENFDAAKMWQTDKNEYLRMVRRTVDLALDF
jgi:ubiquitin-protein ligase